MLTSPDLRLAKAINTLSKDKIAGAESGVLKSYLSEYEYKGGVWANAYAAKANVKNSPNPKLTGISVGYDAQYGGALIGAYTSFASLQANYERIADKGKFYQLSTYARMFVGSGELDLKMALGFGKNSLTISSQLPNQPLNQTGRYGSQFLSFQALHGYVFNPYSEYLSSHSSA